MNHECPICGKYMDYIVTSYRSHPYIDGRCYKKMCFGCAHAPQDFVFDEDEEEEDGPFFDHKHLYSEEDLYRNGSVKTLEEAKRCLRGVRKKIAEVGVRALNKLNLSRPKHEYEFNEEFEDKLLKKWIKTTKKK